MDKIKNNKSEKLLEEIYKAFDLLRGPLQISEAFKVIFVLLHYKRFSDIVEKCSGFDHFIDFVSPETLLPEEYRWQNLQMSSDDPLFFQIDSGISNIYKINNMPIEGIDSAQGIDNALNILRYQSRIPLSNIENLFNIFSSLDLSLQEISYKEFEEVVWSFEGKSEGDSCTPPSIAKLMVELLNPQGSERIDIPFCGLGKILIATIDHAYRNKHGEYDNLYPSEIRLYEKNMERLALQELRFSVAVISNASEIQQHNSSESAEIFLFNVHNVGRSFSSNVVFLIPPFGLRQPSHMPSTFNIDGRLLDISKTDSEIFELLNHLQNLSDHGRMSVVMRFSILSSRGKVKNAMKFLVDNDYIEAVFQLPEKLFPHTQISTAILVINKNKPKSRKHRILFVKIESELVGNKVVVSGEEIDRVVNTYHKAQSNNDAIVTLEEIQQYDYDLSPGRYIGVLSSEIKELIETKAGIALGELCTITKGHSNRPVAGIKNGVPFITTKNLSKDVTQPFLNLEEVEKFVQPITIIYSEDDVIDFSKKCVLISLVGKDLKPTIFDPDYDSKLDPEEGDVHIKHTIILPGNKIAAIFPNESIVDFEYFYYQLYSSIVKKQFNSLLVGTGIPHINISSLNKVVIAVPKTQEEQRAFVKEQKLLLLEVENAKFEAFKERLKVGDRKREAEFEMVGRIEHNISPRLSGAKTCIELSIELLKQKSLSEEAVNIDETEKKIAINKLGIAFKELNLITDILDRARNNVSDNVEEKRLNFQEVDIHKIFEEDIIPLYRNIVGFEEIGIVVNSSEVENIKLDKTGFMEAINNIIKNAYDWGFKGNKNKKAELTFDISEDDDFLIIDYKNNGKMFPKEINEEHFLKRRGHGGKTVNDFLQVHNAELDIVRCSNCNFIIKIPRRAYK
jgi:type I restriction enzyme M protein